MLLPTAGRAGSDAGDGAATPGHTAAAGEAQGQGRAEVAAVVDARVGHGVLTGGDGAAMGWLGTSASAGMGTPWATAPRGGGSDGGDASGASAACSAVRPWRELGMVTAASLLCSGRLEDERDK